MNNLSVIWQGPNGIDMPKSVKEPTDIIKYALALNEKQQKGIISSFQIGAYDMAAEYVWKKGMTKLKETLSTLGMQFIGEMLGRNDINETSIIENVLTDHNTIKLAEQLGVIGPTAALKLKHANELLVHFFSKEAETEIDYNDAFGIIKSTIQYILGEQDISIAIEFSQFRNRLLSETLKISDIQIDQLIQSPLFYLRTVNTILLSSIRNDIGAKLEHALGNLNMLIKQIWPKIGENDKWNIGTAYRDVTAAGNLIAASGLKNALLKVSGFDYVPENLRSVTFKNLAKEVIDIHFGYDNFYNEPAIVKKLANLGSTIPSPALVECIQAYLAIYIGNRYGFSIVAAQIAEEKLLNITKERWKYYFNKVIQNDEITLSKINTSKQIDRFKHLLTICDLLDLTDLPKKVQSLYDAVIKNEYEKARRFALLLYTETKK